MRRTFMKITLRKKEDMSHIEFTKRCLNVNQTDRRIILKTVNDKDLIKIYSIDRGKFELFNISFYRETAG